jgi:hypothetical protein
MQVSNRLCSYPNKSKLIFISEVVAWEIFNCTYFTLLLYSFEIINVMNNIMKLSFFCFIFLFAHLGLHAATDDTVEASRRRVEPLERAPFYEQLNRTSNNAHGKIAQTALEPIFKIIASGDIPAITSIPDDVFNAFSANYMVARHLFKESFRILSMFSLGSCVGEQPKHDMTANLPVNKMDDMLLWAWSIRCDQIDDSITRMRKQMDFIQFKTVIEGKIKKLVPTNQLKPEKNLVVSALRAYGRPQVALPETYYYQEQTPASTRYRIFSATCDSAGRPLDHHRLPNHPIFGSLFFGDVKVPGGTWALEDTRKDDWRSKPRSPGYPCGAPMIKNGAIFRKDGTLFEKNGIVIVPQKPFRHCYLVLEYYKNPTFTQMCLEERAVITEQSVDIAGIVCFVTAFGGFGTIKEQGIGFIECMDAGHPHPTGECADSSSEAQNISIAQARMLLPYLYLLEYSPLGEAGQEANFKQAINLLENVLAIESGADDSLGTDASTDHLFDIKEPEHVTVSPTPAESAAAAAAFVPTTSKRNTSKEEAPDIQQLREARLEEERTEKKRQKLEGIREYFRREAAKLNQYSRAQTEEVLERLYAALSPHGIHVTGKARTRGDHHLFEVTADTTGHSASVGLVLRGKEGFQSGTVKKIIDDHVDNALVLLKLMLRK